MTTPAVIVGYTGPLDQPMSMVLMTADGHTRGPVQVVPDSSTGVSPVAVIFTDRDRGWLVDTVSGAAHILAMANGGRTWSMQLSVPFP